MSQQAGRTGDVGVGICFAHSPPQNYTTVLVNGSVNCNSDGLSMAFVGTPGISTCGHMTIAMTGASFVDADGIKLHRVGDTGANFGPYILVTGSSFVDAE